MKKILIKIIAIIVAIIVIYVIRNFVILLGIYNNQKTLAEYNNYYYISCIYDDNNTEISSTQHYYKENMTMLEIESESKTIIWHDENTKETIYIMPETATAKISNSELLIPNSLVSDAYSSILNILKLSFASVITTENVGDEECYKVSGFNTETYINKDDGTLVKEVTKDSNMTVYKGYSFNGVTDELVQRPDLEGLIIE